MIVFKSIKPGVQFKSAVFRANTRSAAEKVAPEIEKDFAKTTRTWSEKPEFTREVKIGVAAGGRLAKQVTGSATGVSVEVSTDSDIYRFVDEGTKVRYATMTPNFLAKTRPNVIGSRRGRGGVLFVNKKKPRPGIKARNFSKLIQKKWQPRFRKEMQAALDKAAKESGHGVK